MKRSTVFGTLFIALFLAGCATAQKPAVSTEPDARDKKIARLQTELEEQKVRVSEAEARAAKAENDAREAADKPAAKIQDPYLK